MADVIVSPGNSLKVDYIVENFGDDPDTQNVELVRTDTSTVVDSVTGIQLDTGDIDTGELIWSSGSTPEGEYTFNLNTADDTEPIEVGLFTIPTAGSLMYVTGSSSNSLHEYSLSTVFGLSTVGLNNSVDISISGSIISSITWNDTGTKLYVIAYDPGVVEQYSTPQPFDISSLTSDGVFGVDSNNDLPAYLTWSTDGTKAHIVDTNGDAITQYTASAPFDTSSISFETSLDVVNDAPIPRGMAWDKDGSVLYLLSASNRSVVSFDLTTQFDISTASLSQSFDVSGQSTSPSDIGWNVDGSKMFIAGFSTSSVFSYDLSTAFDISTASFNQSFDASTQEASLRGFSFNGDTHYSTYQ